MFLSADRNAASGKGQQNAEREPGLPSWGDSIPKGTSPHIFTFPPEHPSN